MKTYICRNISSESKDEVIRRVRTELPDLVWSFELGNNSVNEGGNWDAARANYPRGGLKSHRDNGPAILDIMGGTESHPSYSLLVFNLEGLSGEDLGKYVPEGEAETLKEMGRRAAKLLEDIPAIDVEDGS
jgi:hypothetical protein